MIETLSVVSGIVGGRSKILLENAKKASADKQTYTEKLERASGEDVFKYILLINVSALEGYVAQTRLQAEQSFRLSKWVAVIGFALIATGIGFGIYLNAKGDSNLEAAYLAATAGVLTEFISGVFFYLYNRTLQQINRFHDKLVAMQQLSMSYLSTSLVVDPSQRDAARIEISKSIISVPANVPQRDKTNQSAAAKRRPPAGHMT